MTKAWGWKAIPAAVLALMLVASFTGCSGGGKTQADEAGRVVRKLVVLSRTQGEAPHEFESLNLLVEDMKKLGLDVELRIMPWDQLSDVVWYQRDKWDMTGWDMIGRPERSDPDEFLYNMFHSSTAADGYNFPGYTNPEYDRVVEQQRSTVDKEQRRQLVFRAQEVLAQDVPIAFFTYPELPFAFNAKVWDASTMVNAAGLGLKNFWTFVQASPLGSTRDMILNTPENVQALNPLYLSGMADSWATELIWDRLMRVGPDGLPRPWAAEQVTWKDPTTVEVKLRSGMKWHDGKPVTVDDVVFSFEAAGSDEVPMFKPFVRMIANMEAVGTSIVRFNLKQPYAPFETTSLAKINLVPKHIWEPILQDLSTKPENVESYQEKAPIGSGPFRFVSWKKSEEIVLAADKSHFAAPKMDRWILRIIPNQEATLGMLTSGQINFLAWYTGDPKVLEEKVGASPDLKLVPGVDIGFRFLAFNHRRPPMDDRALRVAVATLVDRQLIAQQISKGYAVPADSPVSAALEYWHHPSLPYPEAGGVEKAKEILKEAGYEWDAKGRLLYPEGKKETLTPQ